MKREIVIVGGVAAGMSCASKLDREADDVNITVYEKGGVISYGACGLPYYIADYFEDSDKMIARTPEDYKDTSVDVRLYHEVVEVNPEDKTVRVKNLKDGGEFSKKYDELVIASGAAPVLPPFADSEIENLFKLRTVEDAEKIKEAAQNPDVEKVVIVGGGYIGIELVESFKRLGKEISVINRSERIMGSFDEEIRELIVEELKDKNINLHLNDDVEEIIADEEGKVSKVKTDRDEYDADLAVVVVGVAPATEFLKGTGIETLDNGAIIIDEKMKTNIDNIYSAGDCAALYHIVLDKYVHIPLATYSNRQGRLLGSILAGKDVSFPGGIGTSMVKVLDLEIAQTGLNEHQAEESGFEYETNMIKAASHTGYYPGREAVYVKLIFEKGTERLLGAQIAGKDKAALRINPLAIAIERKMTLQEIAYSDFGYAPPFSGVWDPVQIACNASSKKI